MGNTIRTKSFDNFMKKSRHYHVKVIISSQDWMDCPLAARKQIKQFLIFNGVGEDRLETIYKNMDCRLPYEQLKELFSEATTVTNKNKKPFLFAIPCNNDYRISFDKKFENI